MDIRHLRYFIAIARCGSVSAAADALHVAQPSLSQHIHRIEEELSVKLLIRSARGVTLTESGQRLLAHADDIVGRLDAAVAEMRDLSDEVGGPVSIGLPSVAGNVLTVPLAETIRHELPNVTLRMMEGMSGHVQAWLVDGTVDIGILYDVNDLRSLKVQPLMVEAMSLIAAKDNWPYEVGAGGLASDPVRFEDCAALDLILPNRSHGLRETIERYARRRLSRSQSRSRSIRCCRSSALWQEGQATPSFRRWPWSTILPVAPWFRFRSFSRPYGAPSIS